MDRAQLENALMSAIAMRQQHPEGSPEWSACVDTELDLRRKLAMPAPSKDELRGGPRGPRAAGPKGMVDVNPAFLDDSDNPARGGGAYRENLAGIDPRFLDNRNGANAPRQMFEDVNVASGGGGEAIPHGAPPPPPAPPPAEAGPPHNHNGQSQPAHDQAAAAVPPRRGIGRLPIRFNNPGEVVAWGGTAIALGIGLFQGYKKMKGK